MAFIRQLFITTNCPIIKAFIWDVIPIEFIVWQQPSQVFTALMTLDVTKITEVF